MRKEIEHFRARGKKKFDWIKLKTEYPVFSEKVKAKILNEIELEENKDMINSTV
jgi:hypothetical protein